MNIDWINAPEWAIAHAFHATAMGVKEVWVGEDKYQQFDHGKSFPYGGIVGASSYHNPRRYQFAFETPRPAAWTGDGLPPAGTVCEWFDADSGRWLKSEIAFLSSWVIVVRDVLPHPEGPVDIAFDLNKIHPKFRRIRTPEQIAADAVSYTHLTLPTTPYV